MIEYSSIDFPIQSEISAKSMSMLNWQSYFRHVFHENNTRIKDIGYKNNQVAFIRGYLVSHISQDMGELAEAIRESKDRILRNKIGSMFAWIFALVNEFDENLETVIYDKFPGYCPYCYRKEDCDCAWWTTKQTRKGKDPIEEQNGESTINHKVKCTECDKEFTEKIPIPVDGDHKPRSIPTNIIEWLQYWEFIYGAKYKIAFTTPDIMYKLLEEEAEILEELDKATTNDLEKDKEYYVKARREIADFVSWFLALLLKLEQESGLRKDEIPGILFDKFKEGCFIEHTEKCGCTPKWLNEAR